MRPTDRPAFTPNDAIPTRVFAKSNVAISNPNQIAEWFRHSNERACIGRQRSEE